MVPRCGRFCNPSFPLLLEHDHSNGHCQHCSDHAHHHCSDHTHHHYNDRPWWRAEEGGDSSTQPRPLFDTAWVDPTPWQATPTHLVHPVHDEPTPEMDMSYEVIGGFPHPRNVSITQHLGVRLSRSLKVSFVRRLSSIWGPLRGCPVCAGSPGAGGRCPRSGQQRPDPPHLNPHIPPQGRSKPREQVPGSLNNAHYKLIIT